ncbi:MATE family efflux transporter [uncultured Cetobacterium sp.]|uniref:MATE family efflux transporter n=2 Tax=uncultured Cetobacterium sp. TaxID=527638 RepID=UPI0026089302|nr:MATE family efflux transporter [uncultured Cetobacterium sp.]
MDKDLNLETGDIKKLLIKYSIPAIIGMLVSALYNVVDRIFIGNMEGVGALAITGIGITMPIITIVLAFGMLIGIGATANISIKLGEKKKESAEKIIGNIITLSIIIGTLITIVGIIFKKDILIAFGASENTMIYAERYIGIILYGSIFNVMGYALNSTIRADGNPKICSIIMVVSCFLNIILDPIFIFTFNMGIKGAAYATVLSQILTTILSIAYYMSKKSNLKIKKINLRLDLRIVKLILAIGVSPFAMQLAASMVQVVNNNALKIYGGDLAIGAMATVNAIALLCFMPVYGISQGAQPIIGYNFGARQYKRVEKTYKLSANIGILFFLVALFFIQLFPQEIIGLFNKNPNIMKMSVTGVRIYLIAMPAIALGMAGSNYFLAIGKGKAAMFLSLLRQVVLLVPLIILLSKTFGLIGIWMAQPICDLIAAGVTLYMVVNNLKIYRKLD